MGAHGSDCWCCGGTGYTACSQSEKSYAEYKRKLFRRANYYQTIKNLPKEEIKEKMRKYYMNQTKEQVQKQITEELKKEVKNV